MKAESIKHRPRQHHHHHHHHSPFLTRITNKFALRLIISIIIMVAFLPEQTQSAPSRQQSQSSSLSPHHHRLSPAEKEKLIQITKQQILQMIGLKAPPSIDASSSSSSLAHAEVPKHVLQIYRQLQQDPYSSLIIQSSSSLSSSSSSHTQHHQHHAHFDTAQSLLPSNDSEPGYLEFNLTGLTTTNVKKEAGTTQQPTSASKELAVELRLSLSNYSQLSTSTEHDSKRAIEAIELYEVIENDRGAWHSVLKDRVRTVEKLRKIGNSKNNRGIEPSSGPSEEENEDGDEEENDTEEEKEEEEIVFDITESFRRWQRFKLSRGRLEILLVSNGGRIKIPYDFHYFNAVNHHSPYVLLYSDSSNPSQNSNNSSSSPSSNRRPKSTATTNRSQKRRNRRNTGGPTTRHRRRHHRGIRRGQLRRRLGIRAGLCQRRKLYIDFAELRWKDWIHAPNGIHAYACSGTCPFPIMSSLNASNHAVIQSIMHSVYPDRVPPPCCVPTQLTSIPLIYINEIGNIEVKHYENMIVEACGCQ